MVEIPHERIFNGDITKPTAMNENHVKKL